MSLPRPVTPRLVRQRLGTFLSEGAESEKEHDSGVQYEAEVPLAREDRLLPYLTLRDWEDKEEGAR